MRCWCDLGASGGHAVASNDKTRTGTRVPSRRRDVLTGEPLPPDALYVFLVRDEDAPRSRYRDDDATAVPIPNRLHRSAESPEGRLGAPSYSAQFIKRLEEQLAAAQRGPEEWWRDAYAREALRRGFNGRYGAERGPRAFVVALAILEYPDGWEEIAAWCGHSFAWIARQRSIAYRIAFAHQPAAAA